MSKAVYEMVTNRIIKQLESGVIPWRKTWSGTRNGAYQSIKEKLFIIKSNAFKAYGRICNL